MKYNEPALLDHCLLIGGVVGTGIGGVVGTGIGGEALGGHWLGHWGGNAGAPTGHDKATRFWLDKLGRVRKS